MKKEQKTTSVIIKVTTEPQQPGCSPIRKCLHTYVSQLVPDGQPLEFRIRRGKSNRVEIENKAGLAPKLKTALTLAVDEFNERITNLHQDPSQASKELLVEINERSAALDRAAFREFLLRRVLGSP